jgi:hypothetical protein
MKLLVLTGVKEERLDIEDDGMDNEPEGGGRFTAFLARVSTKLDLIDHATEERVARRRRDRSVGDGETVGWSVFVKRSACR